MPSASAPSPREGVCIYVALRLRTALPASVSSACRRGGDGRKHRGRKCEAGPRAEEKSGSVLGLPAPEDIALQEVEDEYGRGNLGARGKELKRAGRRGG